MVQNQSTPPIKDSILNDEMVREETLQRFQKHLPIGVCGYKASSEVILEIITHAAVTGSSIEASCKELAVDMSANTVREHLHAQFQRDNLNDLEVSVNGALRDKLPRRARRRVREIAIDLHDQPYYGEDDELTCRGEAKAGTTRFYRVATAYLIHQGVRFTLGLVFVRPEHSNADVVRRLLGYIRQAGVSIKRLWLDKGFASILVYRLLEAEGISATIACPSRGKPNGSGTRALCCGKTSYHTQHTFKHPKHGSLHRTAHRYAHMQP